MVSDVISITGNYLLDPLVTLWRSFVLTFPNIVLAILLLIIGYIVAWTVGHIIKSALYKVGLDKYIKKSIMTKTIGHTDLPILISEIVKWLIFLIFAALLVSLGQIGVNILLLENTFLILVGAAGLGFAIAVGIGFGLGLRNHAEDILKKFKKHI